MPRIFMPAVTSANNALLAGNEDSQQQQQQQQEKKEKESCPFDLDGIDDEDEESTTDEEREESSPDLLRPIVTAASIKPPCQMNVSAPRGTEDGARQCGDSGSGSGGGGSRGGSSGGGSASRLKRGVEDMVAVVTAVADGGRKEESTMMVENQPNKRARNGDPADIPHRPSFDDSVGRQRDNHGRGADNQEMLSPRSKAWRGGAFWNKSSNSGGGAVGAGAAVKGMTDPGRQEDRTQRLGAEVGGSTTINSGINSSSSSSTSSCRQSYVASGAASTPAGRGASLHQWQPLGRITEQAGRHKENHREQEQGCFPVVFTAQKLGLTLAEVEGFVVVCDKDEAVEPRASASASAAANEELRVGDRVVSVGGSSADGLGTSDVERMIVRGPRPLEVLFRHPDPRNPGSSGEVSAGQSASGVMMGRGTAAAVKASTASAAENVSKPCARPLWRLERPSRDCLLDVISDIATHEDSLPESQLFDVAYDTSRREAASSSAAVAPGWGRGQNSGGVAPCDIPAGGSGSLRRDERAPRSPRTSLIAAKSWGSGRPSLDAPGSRSFTGVAEAQGRVRETGQVQEAPTGLVPPRRCTGTGEVMPRQGGFGLGEPARAAVGKTAAAAAAAMSIARLSPAHAEAGGDRDAGGGGGGGGFGVEGVSGDGSRALSVKRSKSKKATKPPSEQEGNGRAAACGGGGSGEGGGRKGPKSAGQASFAIVPTSTEVACTLAKLGPRGVSELGLYKKLTLDELAKVCRYAGVDVSKRLPKATMAERLNSLCVQKGALALELQMAATARGRGGGGRGVGGGGGGVGGGVARKRTAGPPLVHADVASEPVRPSAVSPPYYGGRLLTNADVASEPITSSAVFPPYAGGRLLANADAASQPLRSSAVSPRYCGGRLLASADAAPEPIRSSAGSPLYCGGRFLASANAAAEPVRSSAGSLAYCGGRLLATPMRTPAYAPFVQDAFVAPLPYPSQPWERPPPPPPSFGRPATSPVNESRWNKPSPPPQTHIATREIAPASIARSGGSSNAFPPRRHGFELVSGESHTIRSRSSGWTGLAPTPVNPRLEAMRRDDEQRRWADWEYYENARLPVGGGKGLDLAYFSGDEDGFDDGNWSACSSPRAALPRAPPTNHGGGTEETGRSSRRCNPLLPAMHAPSPGSFSLGRNMSVLPEWIRRSMNTIGTQTPPG